MDYSMWDRTWTLSCKVTAKRPTCRWRDLSTPATRWRLWSSSRSPRITLSRFTARTWLRIERVCCCTLRDSITMWYCLIESTVVAEARCLFYKVGASERCGRAWCRKVMANTCMHTNEHAYWFCVPDLVQASYLSQKGTVCFGGHFINEHTLLIKSVWRHAYLRKAINIISDHVWCLICSLMLILTHRK